jgi:hypothetical protein
VLYSVKSFFLDLSQESAWGLFRQSRYVVRQEHLFDIEATCNCAKDEGRPLGAGLQEQASNHLKLLWSRARVVSVKEKS